MYKLLVIDGEDSFFYSCGNEDKKYSNLVDVFYEIQELQKIERSLFNDCKIKYQVVKIDE